MQSLRKIALAFPEAQEGIACQGTALECATVMVRKKAFLFLGKEQIRLKLQESLEEATQLALNEPDAYSVGAKGWMSVSLVGVKSAPKGLLKRWIGESYRLMAPKKLAAALPKG